MTTIATTKTPTATKLLGLGGLAAVLAGVIFAGIQPFHPADVIDSVTTGTWTAFMAVKLPMCLLFLAGITALYVRQVGKLGWLGFAGFALLIVSWWLQTSFIFAELFILPILAVPAPQFVESFLTFANGSSPAMDLGGLTAAYGIVGVSYMLGGLLFGIATFRARVLPRLPAALLAVAATLTPAAALLPHALQRYAAIPVAVAVAWLGYTLWAEYRRAQVTQPKASPALSPAA